MIFQHLLTQHPSGAVIVKTVTNFCAFVIVQAFDMIDLPPGATNYLQFFFDKCAVSNETMIWICICTSTCAKQAIRQVRNGS